MLNIPTLHIIWPYLLKMYLANPSEHIALAVSMKNVCSLCLAYLTKIQNTLNSHVTIFISPFFITE